MSKEENLDDFLSSSGHEDKTPASPQQQCTQSNPSSPQAANSSIEKDIDNSDSSSCGYNDVPKLFDQTQPPEVVQPSSSRNNPDIPSSAVDPLENDIDEAIDLLMNRFVLPSEEIKGPLLQLVERRRIQALYDGDYDKAEYQDKIVSVLQMVTNMEQQKQAEGRSIDALYVRWQHLQKQQNEITQRWDEKINKFKDECDEKLDRINEQQEKEIDEFLDKWKDPNFLRPFNKPSSRLLQVREQEKAMAISRMYAQAKEMKAVADKMQLEETRAAQQRINEQMTIERNKLAIKHDKELKAHKTYRSRTVKAYEAEKQKELRPVITALGQIKAKKVSPSKMKSSQLPALPPTARGSESESTAAAGSLYSPRTQTRYSHFRSEKKTVRLDVVPVDEATLAKMKRPVTTTRAKSSQSKKAPTTPSAMPRASRR